MILNIIDAANDMDSRAVVAKSRFRNRKLAVCTKQYSEIGELPVPVQKLLAGELNTVDISKKKFAPTISSPAMRTGLRLAATVPSFTSSYF